MKSIFSTEKLCLSQRGDLVVSIAWTGRSFVKGKESEMKTAQVDSALINGNGGKVFAVRVLAQSYHPWNALHPSDDGGFHVGGMKETTSGYFQWHSTNQSNVEAEYVVIDYPHSTRGLDLISGGDCANVVEGFKQPQRGFKRTAMAVIIKSFPCEFLLCVKSKANGDSHKVRCKKAVKFQE